MFVYIAGKVVITLMDRGQTPPVVVNGARKQVVLSTVFTHPIWKEFKKHTLNTNLRLSLLDPEYREIQVLFANVLKEIRTNGPFNTNQYECPITEIYHDKELGRKVLRFEGMKFFTNPEDALQFLYPNDDFVSNNLTQKAILCATNARCDDWNNWVQKRNTTSLEPTTLFSSNEFADLDDPNGMLNDVINSDTLQYYNKPGVPVHDLKLKVNDICFLMRTLSKKDQLCKNVRVQILKITPYRIEVLVLSKNPIKRIIPRIKFDINHTIGYTLVRTQFPLQLCYAMTINKSQGQTLPWSIFDVTVPCFTHGQGYVALSRANFFPNTAMFCNTNQIFDNAVIFENVVYDELLEDLDNTNYEEYNYSNDVMDVENYFSNSIENDDVIYDNIYQNILSDSDSDDNENFIPTLDEDDYLMFNNNTEY